MSGRDLAATTRRSDEAARRERPGSPGSVQPGKAVRHPSGGIRNATVMAVNKLTYSVKLDPNDSDETLKTVRVYYQNQAGFDLRETVFSQFVAGEVIPISLIGGEWFCQQTFTYVGGETLSVRWDKILKRVGAFFRGP